MDTISKEHRSWNMSRIRSRDTKPEMIVRSLLHRMGFRFRVHVGGLPGKPDIVLPKYRSVVFVHGCYWHRHPGCEFAYTPKSRVEFWQQKFADNVQRDKEAIDELGREGWEVFIVWECETKDDDVIQYRLSEIATALRARLAEVSE